jgi:hypothetical protein
MTKILKRPETAPAVSQSLRSIKVEKTLGSRMTTAVTQKRRDREVKAAQYSIKPVSIAIFERLSTAFSAEMFTIIIEDINEYIEKQIQPEPDPIEVLPVEFRQFTDVFSKEASDTLLEYREEYNHKIELEAGAELSRT